MQISCVSIIKNNGSFDSHCLGDAHHCQCLAKASEVKVSRLYSNTAHLFLFGFIDQFSLLVVDVSISVDEVSLTAELRERAVGEMSCEDVCFADHDHLDHFEGAGDDVCESIVGDDDRQELICVFFYGFVAFACVDYLEKDEHGVVVVDSASLLHQKTGLFVSLFLIFYP